MDNNQSHSEKISAKIYRGMSPSQKWEEAYRLREIAWIIKAAAIRLQHPDWDEEAVHNEVKKIFLYAAT